MVSKQGESERKKREEYEFYCIVNIKQLKEMVAKVKKRRTKDAIKKGYATICLCFKGCKNNKKQLNFKGFLA